MLAALAVVLARWAGGDRLLVDIEARPERVPFRDVRLSAAPSGRLPTVSRTPCGSRRGRRRRRC